MAEIRPARAGDHADMRRIFVATMALGSPPDVPGLDTDAHARLCLDRYLAHGDAFVVEEDGRVRGCLLCCLDQRDHARWSRREGLRREELADRAGLVRLLRTQRERCLALLAARPGRRSAAAVAA